MIWGMTVRSPSAELELLQDSSGRLLAEALAAVEVAHLRSDFAGIEKAEAELARRLSRTMAVADLFGRRRFLLEAKAAKVRAGRKFAGAWDNPGWGYTARALASYAAGASYASSGVPFLPSVPFTEAISDLLRREPELAPGWRLAQEVYLEGGFALARAGSGQVASKVQLSIAKSLQTGVSRELTISRIVKALQTGSDAGLEHGIAPAGLTRAYADVVFRTVTASSYAAGRREQAKDPDLREIISGWRFVATRDPDVRHNHLAADNLIAHMDDPIWADLSPPLGYQCRCSLETVLTDELVSKRIANEDGTPARFVSAPQGARRDPGFGGLRVYP